MKKILFATLMAALLVTAVACSNGGASSSPSSSQPGSSESSSQSESSEPASGSASEAPEGEEQTVTGVVEDAAMHSLVLKLEDGTQLSFGWGDDSEPDKSALTDLTVGDTVKVTYTGEIADGDASGVTVTKLETVAQGEAGGASESAAQSEDGESVPASEDTASGSSASSESQSTAS